MRILLPTGRITEEVVRKAAAGYDAMVVVTGELASFLTPHHLRTLLADGSYDMVITSGMCTASFQQVEEETGVPIYRGPRHAADLSLILRVISTIELSREIPADDLLTSLRQKEAADRVKILETEAAGDFSIRGVKIGKGSRMKVLAEIMDAHRYPDIRKKVIRFFEDGADIVDLGFGFDATADDVRRVFDRISDLPGPLAADTQNPELIRAALPRADLILSLHDGNINEVGSDIAAAKAAVVIVPQERTIGEIIKEAKNLGITRLIADPLLQPAGSGLTKSLTGFSEPGCPLFFGAGNVTELIDADSIGVNALLAAMAHELHVSVIFCSEHSDKTQGSIMEMRRATEMMLLTGERPYPKDLGVDLFCIKEKRRRREPPMEYSGIVEAEQMPDEIQYDPRGNFRIGIEDGWIIAVRNGSAVRGKRWQDVFYTLLKQDAISLLDHAGYLGRELYKAELAIKFGRSFEQDGPF
ncbi:MAG TPA: dihydropteroate synthase-like protein [Methanospirillum sp.]|uniref:dihydropteroate synthase-like protein n=1 Tax=Methanospirillum sp. TaxID=45200 RepID=UPI002B53D21E|nr:dihydropteroate synthase-like protein [Methanospirillum sp.]HWQ63256.1 dihydropteroate synthase-like protein [Methanospirillum sp.]